MTAPANRNYPNIAQSFGITGIVILGILLMSPVRLALGQLIGDEAALLVYYLLGIGIPFWIVYAIKTNKTGDSSFNLSLENKRIIPFLIVGTLALLFGIIIPIISLFPMTESIQKTFMVFVNQTGVFTFILLVFAAPVFEELIFRGIILEGLLKKYSPILSILISSLLFGIVHLNPLQFITGFILGIFSGWVYYKTRNLLYSVIIHATCNLIGFLSRYMAGNDMSSVDSSLSEIYGGLINLVLVIIGSIIVFLGCIYFTRKYLNKQSAQLI